MPDTSRQRRVEDLIAKRRKTRGSSLARSDSAEPPPLATVQLSLWTTAAIDGGTTSTGRPCVLEITGPLDEAALSIALAHLVERHEPLRTIYPLVGEEPIQQVLDADAIATEPAYVDLSTTAPDVREARISETVRQLATRSFDLQSEPQFHPTLIKRTATSHILVLAQSHISFDGWSEAVLVADLLELYRAASAAIEPDLPPLPIRYSDFARWERARSATRNHEAELSYWHETLAGLGDAPPLPGLPTETQSQVRAVQTRLEGTITAGVGELAKREQTTPFVVLLSALERTARDILGVDDFAIDCPTAGRAQAEVANLIGCFINPILIRSSFRSATTGVSHLRAVRTRVLEGLSHSQVPKREILAPWLTQGRSTSLARFSLQWRDFPQRPSAEAASIEVQPIRAALPGTTIAVYATPSGSNIDLTIEYDPSVVSDDAAEQARTLLVGHIQNLCQQPDAPISPPAPAAELPDPTVPLQAPEIESVLSSVARQVSMWPDAVAVSYDDQATSYRELWNRTGQAAAALIEAGVQPGTTVGIITSRNLGQVVALLGALRAGAVAVPLDAGLPTGRLDTMAHAADLGSIITVGDSPTLAMSTPVARVHLDPFGHLEHAPSDPFTRTQVPPSDDLAYVMFTSGTSGTPKGVLGTHQGVAHFVAWQRALLGVQPGDVVACITGPSFDVSLREIFLPLTTGATLAIAPEPLSVSHALDWLTESNATVVHITPSLAKAWMAERARESGTNRECPGASVDGLCRGAAARRHHRPVARPRIIEPHPQLLRAHRNLHGQGQQRDRPGSARRPGSRHPAPLLPAPGRSCRRGSALRARGGRRGSDPYRHRHARLSGRRSPRLRPEPLCACE